MVFRNLLMLSLAGAAGTLARYGASELVAHLAGRKFAWSTLAVNLIGSFLFGLVWALVTRRQMLSPQAGLIILTGFMGAFTTFSTFAFESSEFLLNGKWSLAIANLAAQNGLGMLAVIAGAALARVV